jgi:uncharacterized cupin superfamily protein
MLSGEVFLLEEDKKNWCEGDATCWPAAVLTVHHVESRRGPDASYQTVKTGNKQDAMYYSSSLDNL